MSAAMHAPIGIFSRRAVGCFLLKGFGFASLQELFAQASRDDLARWNAFERYQLPRPFSLFGTPAISANRLLSEIEAAHSMNGDPLEDPVVLYRSIFARPAACYFLPFRLVATQLTGLGTFIIHLLNERKERTLRDVVDEVERWRPELPIPEHECRQHCKLAVHSALYSYCALYARGQTEEESDPFNFDPDIDSYLSTHHSLLLVIIACEQGEEFWQAEPCEMVLQELRMIPAATVKGMIRLVGRLREGKIKLADCGQVGVLMTNWWVEERRALLRPRSKIHDREKSHRH
jgi:hypothetical protein